MIKNIIFDIGGVLITKTKYNKLALTISKLIFKQNKVLRETNIQPKIKKYWREWRVSKITEKEFFEKVKTTLHLKYPVFFIKKHLYSAHEIDYEILNLIKELKQNHKLYSLTNHAREWYNSQNKQVHFDKLFNGIVTSFDAKIAKPKIKIYKLLLNKYKLKPKETIFIDDQTENIVTARNLGIKSIHYKNIIQLKKELKKYDIL
ncbi:HAD-IA family hydrolase [Candidatus Woesearchaeota archaeon]|nr:HAD-IA family hydrolase [Candidatus Woesearchaeota archaeon]